MTHSYYKDAVKDALYPKKKGVLTKRSKYIEISQLRPMSAKEIKSLRLYLQLSTSMFASLFGVNDKTVEAWEHGTNSPSGPALRLMRMLSKNPDILLDGGAVIDKTSLK